MKKQYIAPETQVRVVMAQTMICTSPDIFGKGTDAEQLSKDDILEDWTWKDDFDW